MLEVRVKCNCN